MKISAKTSFTSVLLLLTLSWASSTEDSPKKFLQCLNRHSDDISEHVYTRKSTNYTETLLYSINNLRYAKPDTPKPLVIIRAVTESHVQTVIYCSKKHKFDMRIRSGGHSFEGLSYVSPLPFVILDLVNFKSFSFDAKSKTAWIGSGLTNGELYYNIGKTSNRLGFPSGLFANVGVGGILSGGGYGMMMRKYGLAADHVIDAHLIDANGRILDRKSMGEDWFWAIRGGGGGSFGVVISWKVKLVPVPKTVTVFKVFRTVEQNLTSIFHRYQSVATKFPKELQIKADGQCILSNASSRSDKKTMNFLFEALYLGPVDKMSSVMQQQFPELGVVRDDYFEVSWLEAMVYFSGFDLFTPPEILLNITVLPRPAFKSNNDYTQVPISIEGAGTLFKFNRFAETDTDEAERMEWVKSLAKYLTPYVTKNPRSAYVNYVDLTMGTNNLKGKTSYQQASRWGKRYFKNNFDRLVIVKSAVDPDNFFRHEQSIPPISY
ncbi:cannabidiolic acid synthase-like [Heracleum sosnowskyi]|uniref:Cannabidiolic acid synthase-like n=1 Tax=Heracleum sosnowskyi TaxID=360622 RepID=A0AAD8IX74_9APIA|nr:cannabidiolic acid synthase-like [Heracleum sosnowskyi]